MNPLPRNNDRSSPRRQANWDWRAACNFMAGGSGSGLLLWAACVALQGGQASILLGAGLTLVGFGLTCVWFEIGRPWRALNTFRHIASSWMTREAAAAPLLFFSGFLALWSGQRVPVGATGLFALTFLYSQARILGADKGIPAWRHPLCLQLMVATGLTEGAGLLVCASWFYPQLLPACFLLALLSGLRLIAWRRYLAALTKDGAPIGAIKALRGIDAGFSWGGNALPAILALLAGLSGMSGMALVAGGIAAAAGWYCKYVLVCRASFTQGFAMPMQPVRGRGVSGQGVKPGW